MKKEIIIFACSEKNRQLCLAGKDVATKEWIRPVNDENGAEVPKEKAKMTNPYGDFSIKTLRKVSVPFTAHVPLINQPENYLLSDDKIVQEYKIDFNEIENFLDFPDILWCNNYSSYHGKNDRVLHKDIQDGECIVEQSLYLIEIDNPEIIIFHYCNEKKFRLAFSYNHIDYNVSVTDSDVKKRFVNEKDGNYPLNDTTYLCVSLGSTYKDGYCYKLGAGIFNQNL